MMTQSTTELEAVNSLLSTIAESPVSTLDGTHEDALLARDVLRQVSREVQAEGWFFNREYNYPLSPDTRGEIKLPDAMIGVDVEAVSSGRGIPYDVVPRGNRLYNNTLHTYSFEPGTTVYATVKWVFPFEELPETAKTYIVARASRLFQTKALGSETLNSFTQGDEARTRAALLREEIDNVDANFIGPQYKNAFVGYRTIPSIMNRGI